MFPLDSLGSVDDTQTYCEIPCDDMTPIGATGLRYYLSKEPSFSQWSSVVALPKYALSVPPSQLVEIMCRGECGKDRYARASKDNWRMYRDSYDESLYATCLICGYKATDLYNW